MEQLELTAQIVQVDNPDYPYEMFITLDRKPAYSSWYRGKTVKDILNEFYKSLSDNNLKYWHLLEDI